MGSPQWLKTQVEQYTRLPIYKSYRGISSICLAFSATVTGLSIITKLVSSQHVIDVAILLPLSILVYLGSTWAIVAAMAYWTLSKAIILQSLIASGAVTPSNTYSAISVVAFWILFMWVFYRAFRVAHSRNKIRASSLQEQAREDFCSQCGQILPTDAIFCPHCGSKKRASVSSGIWQPQSFIIRKHDGARYLISLKRRRHAAELLRDSEAAYDPRTGRGVGLDTIHKEMSVAARRQRIHLVVSVVAVLLIAVALAAWLMTFVRQPKEMDSRRIAEKYLDSIVAVQSDNALGSGAVISSDGLILTNKHVVEGATNLTVKLRDGRFFPATSVIPHQQYDLAVISIPATNLTPITIKCQPKHVVGERAVAIGNPEGLERTVTEGIISQLRTVGGKYLIQFDAAVSHGNSGGLLINSMGDAIGIPTVALPDAQNLNFAIPIEYAREFLKGDDKCSHKLDIAGEKINYDMAIRGYESNLKTLSSALSELLQTARSRKHFKISGSVVDDSHLPEAVLLLCSSLMETGKKRARTELCSQQNELIAIFNPSLSGLQRPYYSGRHCYLDVFKGYKNQYDQSIPVYMFGDCIDTKLYEAVTHGLEVNLSALVDAMRANESPYLENTAGVPEDETVVIKYYQAIRQHAPSVALTHIVPSKREQKAFTVQNYELYSQSLEDGPYVHAIIPDGTGNVLVAVSEKTQGKARTLSLMRFTLENHIGGWLISKIVPVASVK